VDAFRLARTALAETALLDHPAADAQLSLVTDASATHIGGVLQQKRRGSTWRPLGFFSQKLSPAQARYSAFDRELLAVYEAILHFRHMLEGRSFVIFTDHLPLVGALSRVSDPNSDRQRRQLSFITEFSTEIRHISGPSNVVADALSRPAGDTPAAGRHSYAQAAATQGSPGGGPLAGLTSQVAAAETSPIPVPTQRFSHLHLDIVGPLPCSKEGFAYLLTVLDRSTRWAEALPLLAVTAADCAAAFVSGWVARYGIPAVVTSDRGVQYTSSFWAAVMSRLGIKQNSPLHSTLSLIGRWRDSIAD
jgi:hypothetical protein